MLYNEIMVDIKLAYLTTSIEVSRRRNTNTFVQDFESQLVITPIRDNIAYLLALDKHVIIPNQDKI